MASNFDTVWKELEAGITRTFQNNRDVIVEETASEWLRMYTTVLTYCTARSQDTGIRTVPVIRGKEIYDNLKKYLVNYIEEINLTKQVTIDRVEDAEKYLNDFMTEWKIYYASIQKLNRTFGYIVNIYVTCLFNDVFLCRIAIGLKRSKIVETRRFRIY